MSHDEPTLWDDEDDEKQRNEDLAEHARLTRMGCMPEPRPVSLLWQRN